MDFHRADWSEFSDEDDGVWDTGFGIELPPEPIGQEERRMQMRAHAYWSSLCRRDAYPPVAALAMADLDDFADHAVLLDFSGGIENPVVAFLGKDLAAECGDAMAIRRLADIPGTSLLSRIADHYVQILAYQAPVGFEAEFVSPGNATTVYRGMLLPFGDAEGIISHVLGVITWKELADADIAASLLAEVRQAYVPEPIGPTPQVQSSGRASLLSPLQAGWHPAAEEPALMDWLVSARSMARVARLRPDGGHAALYAALGAAWDFALAARQAPSEFACMVADAGLKAQARNSMSPLIKLVFGPGYDKTRLTEYATVLAHAERLDLAPGALAGWLAAAPGGLKGAVEDERRARLSGESRIPTRHERLAARLRQIQSRPLTALAADGPEFAVILTRRLATGEVVVLGEASADEALLARMARHLPC